jgi:hypothetical protein
VSRVPPRLRRLPHAVAALLTCAATAACGAPPNVAPSPAPPVPPGTASPSPSASPTPSPLVPTLPTVPSPTGFPDTYAVSCEGKPSGQQIIRLLRRERGLLPDGVRATVDSGPLCSGTWQYTVVVVTGREPLAVVTEGEPGDLRLVTAGTNVCSIPVRTEAPIGIRTAAAC